ncbi:GntR family transcriptional regulator [Streptomyces agglomeratus]|uniref:MocR-like pyridoxine biosynthesis transcription factor PdxR n=2 Tax=Streptomyces TaxID=1883 RepID=UPI00085405CB|nr:PLP-dependent aminotransferase family protein [Streptomyces agglomeratus]OEJ42899.1 GntR family transcriptional regulator [Streptomyces agglomeratus]OEJ55167.1 GntR family transcriptional regulator [Streptomyces agglomeratus]OEJ62540.1 GntR family transcriptional regulator [Streptomyces agglomeratus]
MPNHWASSRLDLHVDLDAAGGRRSGLECALRSAIRQGRLSAGTLLPSTRGLAKELGFSRGTVSAAYGQLVEEGYLTTRPGSGTTVAEAPQRPSAPARPAPTSPTIPRHDLRPGLPDVSAFPVRAWLASTRRVLTHARPEVFGAGDPQGRIELRSALADYLGRTRGVLTTPDRIVITSGYHQGLGLLSGVLTAGGISTAAVEDPGHNLLREVVRRAGLTTLALSVDAHGAHVDALTQGTGAVFLTPSHQYPTGVPLHPSRRQTLRAWARSTGGLIIEDDYDGEYRYDRQPVGALQGIAPDQVVYCGTASKTLGPALRLAWMVLPPHLVSPMVRAKREADLYTETLGQLVLADLIATHAYDRHTRAARLRYRRRRELLVNRAAAIPGLTAHGVPAGLHTLLTLPSDGPTEHQLLTRCAHHGVALRGLTELHHDPAHCPHGLLIGFAAPSEHAYPGALDALFTALASDGRGDAATGPSTAVGSTRSAGLTRK